MATLATAAATRPTGEVALSLHGAVRREGDPNTHRVHLGAPPWPSARARRSCRSSRACSRSAPVRLGERRHRGPGCAARTPHSAVDASSIRAPLDVEGVEEGHDDVGRVAAGVEEDEVRQS